MNMVAEVYCCDTMCHQASVNDIMLQCPVEKDNRLIMNRQLILCTCIVGESLLMKGFPDDFLMILSLMGVVVVEYRKIK